MIMMNFLDNGQKSYWIILIVNWYDVGRTTITNEVHWIEGRLPCFLCRAFKALSFFLS